MTGRQVESGYVFVVVAVGALLVCGTTYAIYVRVRHPSRQKGAPLAIQEARQGESTAVNYAPESVNPKSKTTTPNTTTPNTTTPKLGLSLKLGHIFVRTV